MTTVIITPDYIPSWTEHGLVQRRLYCHVCGEPFYGEKRLYDNDDGLGSTAYISFRCSCGTLMGDKAVDLMWKYKLELLG